MTMPDSNTTLLNQHECAQAKADQTYALYEKRARDKLIDDLFRPISKDTHGKPCIADLMDLLADDIFSALGRDQGAFVKACVDQDAAEIGALILTALGALAENYCDARPEEIERRVQAMIEDEKYDNYDDAA